MTTAESAFWSTAAQIGAVFALTLVLEGRQTARRWATSAKWVRRWEAWVLALGGVVIVAGEIYAFNRLATNTSPDGSIPTQVTILSAGLSLLVINPVLTVFAVAHIDLFSRMLGALPFTWANRERREIEGEEAKLSAYLQECLASIETSDRNVREAKAARALVNKLIADAKATGDETQIRKAEEGIVLADAMLRASRMARKHARRELSLLLKIGTMLDDRRESVERADEAIDEESFDDALNKLLGKDP